MNFSFKRAHLRVASAVFANLSVVWLVAIFGTRNVFTLTVNIIYATLCLYLASKIEELLEE